MSERSQVEQSAVANSPTGRDEAGFIDVILCSRDPNREVFTRTLNSLTKQDLDSKLWKLTIVDNGSRVPIGPFLDEVLPSSVSSQCVCESAAGLLKARIKGIRETGGTWLVFVDDDNFLEPNFLSSAFKIFKNFAWIGAFGGKVLPEFEEPITGWRLNHLNSLAVRDFGDEPIYSEGRSWGRWEPVGAGMCVRREVAEEFVRVSAKASGAYSLGRDGKSLVSCEDSLLARCSYRLGLRCSYEPSLLLFHYLYRSRFGFRYLCRLSKAHGVSLARLEFILGDRMEKNRRNFWNLSRLWIERVRRRGITGHIQTLRDWGYYRENNRLSRHFQSVDCVTINGS
jgi:glycosyltransferase involved in cell wall biosynthesis